MFKILKGFKSTTIKHIEHASTGPRGTTVLSMTESLLHDYRLQNTEVTIVNAEDNDSTSDSE
jgi:hypothetical protein